MDNCTTTTTMTTENTVNMEGSEAEVGKTDASIDAAKEQDENAKGTEQPQNEAQEDEDTTKDTTTTMPVEETNKAGDPKEQSVEATRTTAPEEQQQENQEEKDGDGEEQEEEAEAEGDDDEEGGGGGGGGKGRRRSSREKGNGGGGGKSSGERVTYSERQLLRRAIEESRKTAMLDEASRKRKRDPSPSALPEEQQQDTKKSVSTTSAGKRKRGRPPKSTSSSSSAPSASRRKSSKKSKKAPTPPPTEDEEEEDDEDPPSEDSNTQSLDLDPSTVDHWQTSGSPYLGRSCRRPIPPQFHPLITLDQYIKPSSETAASNSAQPFTLVYMSDGEVVAWRPQQRRTPTLYRVRYQPRKRSSNHDEDDDEDHHSDDDEENEKDQQDNQANQDPLPCYAEDLTETELQAGLAAASKRLQSSLTTDQMALEQQKATYVSRALQALARERTRAALARMLPHFIVAALQELTLEKTVKEYMAEEIMGVNDEIGVAASSSSLEGGGSRRAAAAAAAAATSSVRTPHFTDAKPQYGKHGPPFSDVYRAARAVASSRLEITSGVAAFLGGGTNAASSSSSSREHTSAAASQQNATSSSSFQAHQSQHSFQGSLIGQRLRQGASLAHDALRRYGGGGESEDGASWKKNLPPINVFEPGGRVASVLISAAVSSSWGNTALDLEENHEEEEEEGGLEDGTLPPPSPLSIADAAKRVSAREIQIAAQLLGVGSNPLYPPPTSFNKSLSSENDKEEEEQPTFAKNGQLCYYQMVCVSGDGEQDFSRAKYALVRFKSSTEPAVPVQATNTDNAQHTTTVKEEAVPSNTDVETDGQKQTRRQERQKARQENQTYLEERLQGLFKGGYSTFWPKWSEYAANRSLEVQRQQEKQQLLEHEKNGGAGKADAIGNGAVVTMDCSGGEPQNDKESNHDASPIKTVKEPTKETVMSNGTGKPEALPSSSSNHQEKEAASAATKESPPASSQKESCSSSAASAPVVPTSEGQEPKPSTSAEKADEASSTSVAKKEEGSTSKAAGKEEGSSAAPVGTNKGESTVAQVATNEGGTTATTAPKTTGDSASATTSAKTEEGTSLSVAKGKVAPLSAPAAATEGESSSTLAKTERGDSSSSTVAKTEEGSTSTAVKTKEVDALTSVSKPEGETPVTKSEEGTSTTEVPSTTVAKKEGDSPSSSTAVEKKDVVSSSIPVANANVEGKASDSAATTATKTESTHSSPEPSSIPKAHDAAKLPSKQNNSTNAEVSTRTTENQLVSPGENTGEKPSTLSAEKVEGEFATVPPLQDKGVSKSAEGSCLESTKDPKSEGKSDESSGIDSSSTPATKAAPEKKSETNQVTTTEAEVTKQEDLPATTSADTTSKATTQVEEKPSEKIKTEVNSRTADRTSASSSPSFENGGTDGSYGVLAPRRSGRRKTAAASGDMGAGIVFYGSAAGLTQTQVNETIHRLVVQSFPHFLTFSDIRRLLLNEHEITPTGNREVRKVRTAVFKLVYQDGKIRRFFVDNSCDYLRSFFPPTSPLRMILPSPSQFLSPFCSTTTQSESSDVKAVPDEAKSSSDENKEVHASAVQSMEVVETGSLLERRKLREYVEELCATERMLRSLLLSVLQGDPRAVSSSADQDESLEIENEREKEESSGEGDASADSKSRTTRKHPLVGERVLRPDGSVWRVKEAVGPIPLDGDGENGEESSHGQRNAARPMEDQSTALPANPLVTLRSRFHLVQSAASGNNDAMDEDSDDPMDGDNDDILELTEAQVHAGMEAYDLRNKIRLMKRTYTSASGGRLNPAKDKLQRKLTLRLETGSPEETEESESDGDDTATVIGCVVGYDVDSETTKLLILPEPSEDSSPSHPEKSPACNKNQETDEHEADVVDDVADMEYDQLLSYFDKDGDNDEIEEEEKAANVVTNEAVGNGFSTSAVAFWGKLVDNGTAVEYIADASAEPCEGAVTIESIAARCKATGDTSTGAQNKGASKQTVKARILTWHDGSNPSMEACVTILDWLKNHPKATPFLEPVDPVKLGLPDYFKVVKKPMDITTVGRNLMHGKYSESDGTVKLHAGDDDEELGSSFRKDLSLIFDNAMLFNDKGSWIHTDANWLKRNIMKKLDTEARKLRNDRSRYGQKQKGGGYGDSDDDMMNDGDEDYEDERSSDDDGDYGRSRRSRKRKNAKAEVDAAFVNVLERSYGLNDIDTIVSSSFLDSNVSDYSLPLDWSCRLRRKNGNNDTKAVQTASRKRENTLKHLVQVVSSLMQVSSIHSQRRSTRQQSAAAAVDVDADPEQDGEVKEFYLTNSPDVCGFNRLQVEMIREAMHEYFGKEYGHLKRDQMAADAAEGKSAVSSAKKWDVFHQGIFPPYLGRVCPMSFRWEIRSNLVRPALHWVIRGLVKSGHISSEDFSFEEGSASLFSGGDSGSGSVTVCNAYYWNKSIVPFEAIAAVKKQKEDEEEESDSEDEIELSEYEKARADRVARNKERLKALGLG